MSKDHQNQESDDVPILRPDSHPIRRRREPVSKFRYSPRNVQIYSRPDWEIDTSESNGSISRYLVERENSLTVDFPGMAVGQRL